MKTNMLLTTASLVGDRRIVTHLGIVSGEAILGANIFRDFFAGKYLDWNNYTAAFDRLRDQTIYN